MIETQKPEPPMITLSSPTDLLSAVPYLLGYVPSESIVLIGLAEKDIRISACIPLPEAGQDLEELPIPAEALQRTEVADAILIGYGPAERVTRCIDHALKTLNNHDIEIVEALRVTKNRWWSYICQETSCCPAEGTRFRPESSSVPATMMFNGIQAFSSREEVTRQLDPVDGPVRHTIRLETARQQQNEREEDCTAIRTKRTEATAMIHRALETDRLPSAAETVFLAAAVCDPRVRAMALMAVDERGSADCVRLWLWVTRHVIDPYRSSAAAILSYAAWRDGQGALASEAVKLAVADPPGDRIGRIVARLLEEGVAPGYLPKLRNIDLCD